jgi:serpin B
MTCEPFVINGATSVMVPMMHEKAGLRCAAVADLKLVELPYAGGDVTMLVILPNAADGLASVETALCEGRLDDWLGRLGEREVALTLPRFEFRSHFKLGKTLKLLGMRLAFTPAADFSGMAPNVSIFGVIHEAYVKVDEEGTEAAAATAVVVGRTSMPAPFEFRADHPFLFVIRNTHTGNILFLGRVQNPAP